MNEAMLVTREMLIKRLEDCEEKQETAAKQLKELRAARQSLQEGFAIRWYAQKDKWKKSFEGVQIKKDYDSRYEDIMRRIEFKVAELDFATFKTGRAEVDLVSFDNDNP